MASMLQMFIIGAPLYVIVQDNPPARFLVACGFIFVICTSLLLLIFVPKVAKRTKNLNLGMNGGSRGTTVSVMPKTMKRKDKGSGISLMSQNSEYSQKEKWLLQQSKARPTESDVMEKL